ncbi:MAG TPA: HAD-IIB family hydrolase [Syntrophales bacterium]|nr:HAD-IIB family hydrolase [Syntrophales bacterium]
MDGTTRLENRMAVFTDLDGTLLDHEDYSFAAARPALERLRNRGIPLIFTTSKTRREIESLRDLLGFHDPFISENGGGVFFPASDAPWVPGGIISPPHVFVRLGKPYGEIRRFMKTLDPSYGVRGFGDMEATEISRLTDLSHDEALRAAAREFTEPFLLEREESLPEIEDRAALEGLRVTRGGRFHHLIGANQDKGKAVRLVTEILGKKFGKRPLTVGLGDSPNDFPMLESVDMPVLIPHPDGQYEPFPGPDVIRAPHPGSRGWNAAMEKILDRYTGTGPDGADG